MGAAEGGRWLWGGPAMENASQTGSTDSVPTLRDKRIRSVTSAVLSMTLMLGAGITLGFASQMIGLSHPKGVIFKFLIAFPISLVGSVLLYRYAFVRRHVLVLAGLGAAAAMLTIHCLDYRDFPGSVNPRLRDVIE